MLKKSNETAAGNGIRKECLSADVRAAPHLRVDDLMPAERAGLSEALAAHFAHKGPGPGVHRHVSGQIIMCIKYL